MSLKILPTQGMCFSVAVGLPSTVANQMIFTFSFVIQLKGLMLSQKPTIECYTELVQSNSHFHTTSVCSISMLSFHQCLENVLLFRCLNKMVYA
jgi:hypothetical protein